jgi:type IV pilus assembly protein PilB
MKAIHNPFGMVLVTGPTGSGKTTTLYSALAELNKVTENISTAEDPVEYNLAGINQVQMHDDIGLNFAAALRSFLRQDPDIIMVGEIRDFETAEIAVKAALTGHMVLSTLHTNDAPSTVSRMLNMGIEPFMVTAATNLVLAQRLARRICKDCKQEIKVANRAAARDRLQGGGDRAGRGAALEGGRLLDLQRHGLQGPRGALRGDADVGRGEGAGAPGRLGGGAQDPGDRCGLRTLRMSGISKCLEGVTTTEEIVRVTASDMNKSAT